MPNKRQYDRLRADNRCPKCGQKLDDIDYVTCSNCRSISNRQNKKYKEKNEIRQSAMTLFGIKRG